MDCLKARYSTAPIDSTSSDDSTETKILRMAAHKNRAMVTSKGWGAYSAYRADFEGTSSIDPVVLHFRIPSTAIIKFYRLHREVFIAICSFLTLRDFTFFIGQTCSGVIGISPAAVLVFQ